MKLRVPLVFFFIVCLSACQLFPAAPSSIILTVDPNFAGVIGWEADRDGVIAYSNGSFLVRVADAPPAVTIAAAFGPSGASPSTRQSRSFSSGVSIVSPQPPFISCSLAPGAPEPDGRAARRVPISTNREWRDTLRASPSPTRRRAAVRRRAPVGAGIPACGRISGWGRARPSQTDHTPGNMYT